MEPVEPVEREPSRLPAGVALATARVAGCVSSAALARRAGISRWHLSRLEQGAEGLSPALLAALYRVLGELRGEALERSLPPPDDPGRLRGDRMRKAWQTRRAKAARAARAPQGQGAEGQADA